MLVFLTKSVGSEKQQPTRGEIPFMISVVRVCALFAAFIATYAAAPAHAANSVIASHYAGLCIQISGSGAVTAKCTATGAQQFAFSGYGVIQHGGKCLTGTGDTKQLFLAPCKSGNKDQKWGFQKNGQLNNEGGWCADIERESKNSGARVISYKCKGSTNQKWRLGEVLAAKSIKGMPPATVASLQRAQPGQVVDLKSGKLIGQDGGSIVASGGGNIVAAGAGNLVASGGGNIVAAGGGNLINFKK